MSSSSARFNPPDVLLIDAHGAAREGLALLLRRAKLGPVACTGDAERGILLAASRRPGVIVVDPALDLGSEDLESWLLRLREEAPEARILVHTSDQRPGAIDRVVGSGIDGLALKTCSAEDLVGAVRALADGRDYMDPRAATLQRQGAGDDLSPRETEILTLLADGLTGEQVATELFISPETVRCHVRNAMRKLGATTRARAVVVALEAGRISAALEPAY